MGRDGEKRLIGADQTDTAQPEGVRPLDPRVRQALEVIHNGADPLLAICDLAHCVGLSQSHFHRLFRRETGATPAQYIAQLRIRQAANLIRMTALPLCEILRIVGITDRSHFRRTFKRCYGVPPTAYRSGLQRRVSSKAPRMD